MSLNEYHLYARGYFMRTHRAQEPFRELYRILWNANVDKKHRIISNAGLRKHWPLLTDSKENVNFSEAQAADMQARWNKAQETNKRMKEKLANATES